MAGPTIPRYVSEFARQHRINLSAVTLDEPASLIEVSAWLWDHGQHELSIKALTAQFEWNTGGVPAATPTSQVSRTARPARPDPYALNPLVDQARAVMRVNGWAQATSRPPALFGPSGDLPAFTASGIPPKALLDVPWQARHAMAAAPTAAEAYAISQECTGTDAVEAAKRYAGHDGNQDYADRVQRWQLESMPTSVLQNSIAPGAREELARREAAMPLDVPDDEAALIDAAVLHGTGIDSSNGR